MVSDLIRLGSDFELDRRTYELRRAGRALKLERIPMELLLLLVERQGQLVTREEIIERIWGKDVFLDTDNSINAAIRKIRQALRDDPDKPLFVQTITGKGYRFVAPTTAVQPEAPSAQVSGKAKAPTGGRKRPWVIIGAVALAAVAGSYFYLHRGPKLTEKDTIVLADFKNTTGDPVFDETLRQGMAVQLEQSPFLSLISEERIQQTLRMMGQPPDTRLTPEVARDICQRTASAAVLDGSIASLGSQYVLGLRARDCHAGGVLAEEQVQAGRKEDVLNALTQIASRFRRRVGESLATVERHNTPLAEATTPSLEALKAYSMAWKVAFTAGYAAAVPLFKHAIEIDPGFAMAYASLGRMYGDIGDTTLSAESTAKAYQLRERTSDREKLFIAASYDLQVTGNMSKAQQTLESWAQTYPRDAIPHGMLSADIYQGSGRYAESVEEAEKGISLDPDFVPGYENLAFTNMYLDRPAEAEGTLRRAAERHLEIPDFVVVRYYISFLKDDKAGMEQEAAQGQGSSAAGDWITQQEAFVLARSGHLQEARNTSRRAVDLARQADQTERAALYEAAAAIWEALFRNVAEAKESAAAALELSKARDVEFGAAFALGLLGDSTRSQALADDLEKRFPEDTSVQFTYIPTLRALSAVNRDEPSKAVDLLQLSTPYDLAVPGSSFFGFFGALYPAYVRGEAYLAAQRGPEAVSEFQKILDHRGIVLSDPIGSLARLQLGRAYALSGDKAKAQNAYRDFVALWRDADPDIPVLKQATTEYARLLGQNP